MVSEFKLLDHLLQRLDEARHVMVLTGAGMSAESGIPTFRDAQSGIWAKYRPEELATPQAFEANPARVWQWYEERRKNVRRAGPHAGHAALVELESLLPSVCVVTQNVDGLHARAGNKNPIELHGNIMRSRCLEEGTVVEEPEDDQSDLPRCPTCGGLLRPDVVWFGEQLPGRAFQEAIHASRECDVFMAIGTSGVVQPAASLGLEAQRSGATFVEINIQETPVTAFTDYSLHGPAGELLPLLISQVLSS